MKIPARVVALVALPAAAAAQPPHASEASPGSSVAPDTPAGFVADDAIAPDAVATDALADDRAPRVHSLEALLALAVARYPGLEAAEAGIDAAEARLREAHISPFMQFQLDLGAAMVPDAAGTPTFTPGGQLGELDSWGPAASLQFSGALPLFTFGKLREAWNAAEAGIDAAEAGRDRSRAQLLLDVRRAYFGLSFALDVLQMISEGEGRLESALRRFDERIEEGDVDLEPMDRYRLAAALAEIRARKSQAQLAEASARSALRALTGLEAVHIADCPLEVVDAALPASLEPSARPELSMLAAAREARRAERDIHRARFFPDLVLAMSASYSVAPGITDIANPFIQDRGNIRGLGFGLGARWSLDFGGGRMRVLRAEAQLAEIDAQVEEAQLGADLEQRVARERLADASRRVQAWSQGERETRQWFVSAVQGYQVGTVEPKALVDAIKAYFASRAARLEATLDYNLALAQLERLSGREIVPIGAWEPRCE